MDIISIIDYCLGFSYSTLQEYASDNYKIVHDYIKNNRTNVNPDSILIGLIYTAVASNNKLFDREKCFVKDLIGGRDGEIVQNSNDFAKEDVKKCQKI